MFLQLEQFIISFAGQIPLPVFVFLATMIEEIIPPIPSPSIMIMTGFLAFIQDYPWYGLVALCILGIIGKTLGAWVIYFVADKVENLLTGHFGKFFGVSPGQIEAFGARLGKGPRDYFILIFLRAIPLFPSTVLSVGGGLLKISLRLFLVSTIVGSLFRSSLYFYIGYIGTNVAESFIKGTNTIESALQIIAVLAALLFLGFLYYRRRQAEK